MNRVSSLNYFSKKNTIDLKFFKKRVGEDRNGGNNFRWKNKMFFSEKKTQQKWFWKWLGNVFLACKWGGKFIYLSIYFVS